MSGSMIHKAQTEVKVLYQYCPDKLGAEVSWGTEPVRRATSHCDAQASDIPSGGGVLVLAGFVSVVVMSCAVM